MNEAMKKNYVEMGIKHPFSTPYVENPQSNFKSLLEEAQFMPADEHQLCRFDLFCVRRPECGTFRNGKLEFTIRGDIYATTPEKMLRYLLGIVKKYYAQYALLMLRDNSMINTENDRTIFKMNMSRVERCKLPDYAHLLNKFYLPEWLAVEVDEEKPRQ